MEPVTIVTLLGSVSTVFTAALGWAGTVGEAIVSNSLLVLSVVALPLIGVGIGMFKGMISTRA